MRQLSRNSRFGYCARIAFDVVFSETNYMMHPAACERIADLSKQVLI